MTVFFTDAVPPSLAFLLTWTFVLGASFVVFGLVRPTVRGTRPLTAGKTLAPPLSLWWARQLHYCVAAWPLFDVVHRLFSYIFLPSRVLWRRHMLPLPDGILGSWVNQLRPLVLYVFRGKNVEEMWADVQLPVASFASSVTPHVTGGIPSAALQAIEENGRVTEKEWKCCQWVALVSLMTTILITFLACSGSLYFFPLNPSKNEVDEEEDRSEVETTSDDDTSSDGDQDLWRELGEPDDSCLLSPEAMKEEERWKLREAEERCLQRRQRQEEKKKHERGIYLLLSEYWPVLLSVCYAGLYASTGGTPLLMQYVYPCGVMLVTLFGMNA
ncbi:hypothetical protein MOQ_002934 [Trypanosoma cruzi marinkellei]|uniref:Uncharacterized protein n=1 Tax=Trypanosoma cruzi marinkellei TaxID=85056 RepID=K2NE41_TRYCR|nr:hypothetical protein MOQ_002934 [Trypanosoma cruzi marinkellei]